MAGEVFANILLDKLDAEIWVIDALYLVPNTADCRKIELNQKVGRTSFSRTKFVCLSAAVDKLARRHTGVASIRKHGRGLIESSAETAADCQQTRCERGNQVFAGTCRHDRVHGARDGWAVIGRQH